MSRANPQPKAFIAAAQAQALAAGGVDATKMTDDSERAKLLDGGVTLSDGILVLFTCYSS